MLSLTIIHLLSLGCLGPVTARNSGISVPHTGTLIYWYVYLKKHAYRYYTQSWETLPPFLLHCHARGHQGQKGALETEVPGTLLPGLDERGSRAFIYFGQFLLFSVICRYCISLLTTLSTLKSLSPFKLTTSARLVTSPQITLSAGRTTRSLSYRRLGMST